MNRGYSSREQAAKAKAESRKVDPETRDLRAAVLERREALLAGQQAAVEAEQQARPDAIIAVLQHASETELAEFARVAGQVDPRRLVEIASDLLRQRQRSKAAPQEAQEAAPATKVSSSTRTR